MTVSHSMTRISLLLVIFFCLSGPAWGDLTFGVVPGKTSLVQNKAQAARLANYLRANLHETVKLRIFNSEQRLREWMNRYREVDIAILSQDFLAAMRQGEFFRLVDYLPETGSGIRPGSMVARRGLGRNRRQQLQDLLLVMDTDRTALPILRAMHVADFGTPGAMVELERPTRPAKRKSAAVHPASTRPAPDVQRGKAAATTSPARKTGGLLPAVPAPDKPAAGTLSSKEKTGKISEPPSPVTMTARQQPITRPAQRPQPDRHLSTTPPTVEVSAETSRTPGPVLGKIPTPYTRQARHVSADNLRGTSNNRHYLLLIVAVVLSGLLVKFLLIYQRRPRRRPPAHAPQLLIQHDWSELHNRQTAEVASEPSTPTQPPFFQPPKDLPGDGETGKQDPAAETVKLPSGQLQLDGKLGPRQIPALLQLISASKQSGMLQVSSKHNRKEILFRQGKITSVSSLNLGNHNQTGFLMNKLGYLLVREGKISEDQRDQALVMCEGDNSLRLGEALIRMGALKNRDLLESLRYQAKMVLHSLIVFPEGVFEFIPGNGAPKSNDNLNLSVDDFLKEAAAHQNEWRNIREMIPTLDTVLEFAPGGRDKANSGRMTVHQKFVLSLIDGKRPIRDVCVATTMLDYELYRFLYLMTKADILRITRPD
ncbi:hypothetical protein B5V00_02200 [Geothermobacter hydrogeniphilus]|uniref:PatA-like N-terminal domain-containing protein n=2 Tax=Geothermobacter hydrogeniphilus TaxID=1969733 RepID=A0A1X0YCD8_9BACT|nr:hypothetical protein B5V00_02200 [Geothermobacter hydrogeniphilus]